MTALELDLSPKPVAWRWITDALWRMEHAFERARAEGRTEDARLRLFFVTALFAAAFISLGVGATRAALFNDEAAAGGSSGLISGARADLVDRNGQLLAVDLPYYGLYVDRSQLWDPEETRRVLGPILDDGGRQRLEKALTGKRRTQVFGPLSPEQRAQIADLGLPGVSFEPEARRAYPLGSSAAHLIGFAGAGGVGRSGAELALDKIVRQQAGRAPVPLSIDLRVQAALEDEVKKAAVKHQAIGAVGLVTNVRTGEILGMVSWPDYDPGSMDEAPADAQFNRAAASVYEMGSIFKVFSVAMGLDSGTATLSSTFDARSAVQLGSRRINDFHAENSVMTLTDVFLHSSNIGTSKLALQAGAPTLTRYYQTFGLFEPAKVELTESARPILPTRWGPNEITSASFGHAMSVSPLAVAAGMGSIFNGGTYVPLTVLKVEPDAAPEGRRVVSEQTSRAMLELMRLNVTTGTGGKADAEGLRVGGKTGSAEKALGGRYVRNKLVSSFAAVFPTDGPLTADRYFVLVLLDEPKGTADTGFYATGGWTATPATGRVIDRIAPFLGVTRVRAPLKAEPSPELLSEIEQ